MPGEARGGGLHRPARVCEGDCGGVRLQKAAVSAIKGTFAHRLPWGRCAAFEPPLTPSLPSVARRTSAEARPRKRTRACRRTPSAFSRSFSEGKRRSPRSTAPSARLLRLVCPLLCPAGFLPFFGLPLASLPFLLSCSLFLLFLAFPSKVSPGFPLSAFRFAPAGRVFKGSKIHFRRSLSQSEARFPNSPTTQRQYTGECEGRAQEEREPCGCIWRVGSPDGRMR